MGYRSTVVIAADKSILAQDLIHPTIPAVIKELEYTLVNGVVFWEIEECKWYSDYPEVQGIIDWFDMLVETPTVNGAPFFGAMRLGEDADDVETWGEPSYFDIYHNAYIDSPIN